jgi:hypothetical protein
MLSPDVRLIALLALLPAWGAPQDPPPAKDPPKVTYEDSGDFRLLVMDLERRFKGRARFEKGIESRNVSISVRDAGYFEALDALCRANKEATYIRRVKDESTEEALRLSPVPWIELPTSYHGHFKAAVVAMVRTVRATPKGDEADVQVGVALFSPPWISLSYYSGSGVNLVVEEAIDSGGRDVRISEENMPALVFDDNYTLNLQGPVCELTTRLKDVDLSKGLKSLRGTFKVTAADSRVARMEAKEGSVLETPFGRLTVDGVKEFDRDGESARWRIALSFAPKEKLEDRGEPLSQVLERRVSYDGIPYYSQWSPLELAWKGTSLRVETAPMARAPRWIEFKLRGPEREFEVPIRFTDVVLRERKP